MVHTVDFKTISDCHIKAESQMGKKCLRADDQRTVDDCQIKGESHIDPYCHTHTRVSKCHGLMVVHLR